MKKAFSLCLAAALAGAPLRAAAVDPYEELASKLSSMAGRKMTEKKIAVLTFEYVDGRSSPGGRAVAEKLTNRFVELGEFTVIERGMVEKVMKELEFQNTGGVDSEAAKKLGKGLGVEAIVTGTLSDASYGNVEVNARVIKTETYEIVAAGSMKTKKTWSDAPAPAAEAPAAPAYSAPASRSSARSPESVRFLDVMLGMSTAEMDVEFSNPTQGEGPADLGIPVGGGFISSVSADALSTTASVPFSVRVGGFGKTLGGALEFGMFSHTNDRQRAPVNVGGFSVNLTVPENFLTVNTVHISGDMLLRFPTGPKVIPYFGLGGGLSINNITSDYVRMNNISTLLNQTVPGFLMRVPFGLRINLNERLSVFGEGRIWLNTFTFDRGFSGETDTITQRGFQFLTGLGLLF
jgi:hypothetical protein